jgi:drug/metabolite transporter (DMT)-like permease
MSSTIRGAVYALLAAAIWGGMYVVSDVVLEVIPPFTLLTIRLILGIAVLGLLLYGARGQQQSLTRSDLLKLLAVGFLGFGISVGAQFVGTDESNAVNGALVTSASPAFIVLFAAPLLREKLTPQRIIAVVVATIGVVIIVDPTKADFSSETFRGNLVLVLAAITWGLYSVLVRMVSTRIDTLTVTFVAFVGGLLLTIPTSAFELQSRPIGTIDTNTVLGILYLGVISTAGAMWLWNRAFALIDAGLASLFFFAQPVVGVLLGAWQLGQPITTAIWMGGILIAAGVLLSFYPVGRKRISAQH